MAETTAGTVYLVGAGPGDVGLATVRAIECLTRADVVVYDNLVNPELLEKAPAGAERIYVGKQAGQHSMVQEDINQLLARKALEGRIVVRLKGGDPYIFGRGAEEALVLREQGVPFEVVPGITAGVACAAYAGIPVTYRAFNSTLTFVTGHEDPTKEDSAVNWKALASLQGTLVFYMGVKNLPSIAASLVQNGASPATPAAVIEQGTKPSQQVVTGTLADIADKVRQGGIKPPALTVVGEVVGLRDRLSWFERRPLFGRRIVVTRTRTQASGMKQQLEELGAHVLQLPTIAIVPPDDSRPLDEAVARMADLDWILFTSANAADGVFAALDRAGLDSRQLAGRMIGAVGAATAERLRQSGIRADRMPEKFTGQALFETLQADGQVQGKRFLLPRADIAPPDLPDNLRKAGGTVTEVVAYRTVPAEPAPAVLEALEAGRVDLVTFSSSSTVRNYAAMMRRAFGRLPDGPVYASIGPETSAAARDEGIPLAVEAREHTIAGLVTAIVEQFGNPPV